MKTEKIPVTCCIVVVDEDHFTDIGPSMFREIYIHLNNTPENRQEVRKALDCFEKDYASHCDQNNLAKKITVIKGEE